MTLPIQALWDDFTKDVLVANGVDAKQQPVLRWTFYAGAYALLATIMDITDLETAEGAAKLAEMEHELKAFLHELAASSSQAPREQTNVS